MWLVLIQTNRKHNSEREINLSEKFKLPLLATIRNQWNYDYFFFIERLLGLFSEKRKQQKTMKSPQAQSKGTIAHHVTS